MKKLCLLGKEYDDTIVVVDSLNIGETNDCLQAINKKGGIFNFIEAGIQNWSTTYMTCGSKKAYIISEKKNSVRSSIVGTKSISVVPEDTVVNINENFDWLHIAYLDDIESFESLENLSIPFSLDFCTDKPRDDYIKLIHKASVVFDSRERKNLYNEIVTRGCVLLHDERGFEVIQGGKIIVDGPVETLNNLNVNGAGDIYAARFIDEIARNNLFDSARLAADSTTDILKNRNNNE